MQWDGFERIGIDKGLEKLKAIVGEKEKKRWSHTVQYKFATTLVVFVAVIGMAKVQTPLMDEVSQHLRSAMSLDVNVDQSLGKAKFIENTIPGSLAVSDSSDDSESVVAQDFRATKGNGVVFQINEGGEIRAFNSGVITENTGKRLALIHTDGTMAVYTGIKEAPLGAGTNVQQGDIIAVAAAGGVRVRIYEYDRQIDPLAYIAERGEAQ